MAFLGQLDRSSVVNEIQFSRYQKKSRIDKRARDYRRDKFFIRNVKKKKVNVGCAVVFAEHVGMCVAMREHGVYGWIR